MYTTVDQIEAILRLYKDPFGQTFDSTKYTTSPPQESPIMSSPVVQTWQDQTWQDQTWQGQTWQGQTWQGQTWQGQTWQDEFENFIQEFSVSPLTMFIYSVN